MCGIAGVLDGAGRIVNKNELQAMTDAIAHRGPDGEGLYLNGRIGLGHRRLSIIDLDGGKQPLCNEDETVWVTFNGEIYNYRELRETLVRKGHRFRTESDTEVLVHAWEEWGTDCVQALRGMFAFAIWDQKIERLFLARDRVGIKPLVYWQRNGKFLFASELQSLATHPDFYGTVNLAAIDQFLHYQYIPAPATVYNESFKLPPGHWMIVERDGKVQQPVRYWRVQFEPDRTMNEEEWVERLTAAIDETVKTHLVSDVSFGAFLSGGIDSSIVVASMSRTLSNPVHTFCIGYDENGYDERRWAREAAMTCGADFHERVVKPDGIDILPQLVQHYGEPFADSSAIPTYYAAELARSQVKMVLSGDGGDELFAGYNAYRSLCGAFRGPDSKFGKWRHAVANVGRDLGVWPKVPTIEESKFDRTAVIPAKIRFDLWRPEYVSFLQHSRQDFNCRFRETRQPELMNHLQAFDLENYIPFDNLTKVDVATMYHSLEVRVPFLDHHFIEIAAQVPPELKIKRWSPDAKSPTGKHILKRVAAKDFSESMMTRPKSGFEVPIRDWFAGTHRNELRCRLLGNDSALSEWFEPASIKQLVDSAAVDKVAAWRTWSLLILDEWVAQEKSRQFRPLANSQSN